VHRRGPVFPLILGLGLVCAAALVVAGGLALRGPGLIAVGAAGALAGCLAAGMARENPDRDRRAMAEAAVLAVGGTIGGLLVLCGAAALFGSGPTAVLAGAAVIMTAVVWLVRAGRTGGSSARPSPAATVFSARGRPRPSPGTPSRRETVPAEPSPLLPPVDQLSTRALGREWLCSTAALAGRLDPGVRASIVRRREGALDELERRDPEGFARWLAAGPAPGSDPADWLHTGAAGSTEAA
jgi:hypothetical protein